MRARSQTMIPISNLNKEILKKQAPFFVRQYDKNTFNIGILSICRSVDQSLDRSHFSTTMRQNFFNCDKIYTNCDMLGTI